MQMLVDYPRILPKFKNLLKIPGTDKVHPLYKKLMLIACRVSGNPLNNKTFPQKQLTLSCSRGESPL